MKDIFFSNKRILNQFKNEFLFKRNKWTLFSLFVCILIFTPIALVALQFNNNTENWDHIQQTVLSTYIFSTLILVLSTAILSTFLGVTCAWLVACCEFPGRKFFEWTLILPLTIPTYIAAYSYYDLLEMFTPMMIWIRTNFSPESMIYFNDIMVYLVTSLVMTSVLFPYVYLSTRASFLMQGNQLIEAAKTLGHTPLNIFWKVALPMARPAIIAGLSLVVMETLNDYGAVEYFGIPTFTIGIFRSWLGMNDMGSALKLSSYLLFFVFFILYIEKYFRGEAKFHQKNDSSRTYSPNLLKGKYSILAIFFCLLPLCLGFIIPITRLLFWASSVSGRFFDIAFFQVIFNSIGLASVSSLLIVTLATILIFTSSYFQSKLVKVANQFAILGYSMPGAVVAMGFLLIAGYINQSMGYLLTGTLILLAFAYLVRFLAVAWQPIDSGMEKKCDQINQASRILGNSALISMFKLNLPLLKKSIIVAVLLIFVDIFKELPLTLILRPFNFDTLATLTYDLNSQAQLHESAIPALLIILVTIPPIIFLNNQLDDRL